MKKILIYLICCLFPFIGASDILRWQVNENTTVDGISIQQFLVPYPSDDDHFPSARVKLVSSDGTTSTILKIWGEDEFGNPEEWDSELGVELSDPGSGHWGAGAPTGVNSETGHNTIRRAQDMFSPNPPSLENNPDVMEALFVMELGHNTWNDSVDDWVWQTLAQSNPEMYQDLIQNMYATGDIAPNNLAVWTPDFYTTSPEPNTCILLLIGVAFLALRRKRA